MAQGILERIRSVFEGPDAGVSRVAEDPVLSSELLLLFRVILADGVVEESEMEAFRRICRDAFGIPEESIDGVVEYLNDFGYETDGGQALDIFLDLPEERRRELARHMGEIAKADAKLAKGELRLIKRSLDILGLTPTDLQA